MLASEDTKLKCKYDPQDISPRHWTNNHALKNYRRSHHPQDRTPNSFALKQLLYRDNVARSTAEKDFMELESALQPYDDVSHQPCRLHLPSHFSERSTTERTELQLHQWNLRECDSLGTATCQNPKLPDTTATQNIWSATMFLERLTLKTLDQSYQWCWKRHSSTFMLPTEP